LRAFAKLAAITIAAAVASGMPVGTVKAAPHAARGAERCTPERAEIAVPGHAMSVLASRDGCTLYVSVSANGAALTGGIVPRNGVAVLRLQHHRFVQAGFLALEDEPSQMVLSADERRMYIADNRAGIAEANAGTPVTLKLRRYLLPQLHGGFFQIALSPRGDVLYGGAMKIDRLVAIPLTAPQRFKSVPTDHFPVGLALSRDGRSLYVTNAVAVDPAHPQFHPVKCSYSADPRELGVVRDEGTLEILDPAALLAGRRAEVSRVRAACAPVRVALDERDGIVWMTARESDLLIGYRTSDLQKHASSTVPILIKTGKSPVGLAVSTARGLLVLGNSARFEKQQRQQSIAMYALRALLGKTAPAANVENVGAFPRDIAVDGSGSTVYVANFGSSSVTIIPVQALRE
jgi:DNA-binding beta-propeller fold protein YncE